MIDAALSTVRVESLRPAGGASPETVWLLRAEGVIDSADHPVVRAVLQSPADLRTVTVDLTLVPLLSTSGARGLLQSAQALAETGRALYLCGANATVQRVLDVTATAPLTVLPALADVLLDRTAGATAPRTGRGELGFTAPAALRTAAGAVSPELSALRAEVRGLRGRLRTRPLVDLAIGMLQERYGLNGPEAGFALLRSSSQRHNVKLRSLAAAVVAVPRPQEGAPTWFPGRTREVEPRLGFLEGSRPGQDNRSAVVDAVLDRVTEISSTTMGDVQLVDCHAGGLRLEKEWGLGADFAEHFAHVDEDAGTPGALAVRRQARITVADVARDRLLTEQTRAVLLDAGSLAVYSTPLTTDRNGCVGVVSAHLDRPAEPLTAAQARALDEVARQAGRWLSWHRATVLPDALEHLHREALAASRSHRR